MIGALACLVVGLTPGTAQAQDCRLIGRAIITNVNNFQGNYTFEVEGQTAAYSWNPGSFVVANLSCPLSDSGVQRIDIRINGGATFCDTNSTIVNGWCVQRVEKQDGFAFATATSPSSAPRTGQWCAELKHLWEPTNTSGQSWGCWTFTVDELGESECTSSGHYWNGGICEFNPDAANGSPILIPVTQVQAYKLTSIEGGVLFDINGDGSPEQMAWTAPGSRLAFLAIDRNGNGTIDNGTELFGNYTLPGITNGFTALEKLMPINGPLGHVDDDDPIYSRLLLWEDVNHDGISQPSELRPASDLLTKIGTGAFVHKRRDGHGNLFQYQGWAEFRTGPGRNPADTDHVERLIKIYDVFFKVQ